ncbi:MAG: glycosyltransferase [Gammaproteobacteria bacterium]
MTQSLQIAQVLAASGGGMGGLEKHTLSLCAALAEQHEIHLLAGEPYRALCAPHVHFHAIDFRKSRYNPFLYDELKQRLKAIQPTLIHAQAGKATSLLANLRLFFPKTPRIATIHGTKKHLRAYGAMDGVIAVSSQLASGFAPEQVRVIYNGVALPTPLTAMAKRTLKTQLLAGRAGPLLVAVGRLVPIKGFDTLLRAMVGIKAQLCIVGDGEERAALYNLAHQLALEEQIQFLGFRADIKDILQAAELCVVSSHQEGGPIVLVEALQAGCPVVGSKVGMMPEWLPATALVEPRQPAALHQLLQQVLGQLPVVSQQYAPICQRAQYELTVSGMAQRTSDYYRQFCYRSRIVHGY